MQGLRLALLLCVVLPGTVTRAAAQVAPTHDFLSGPRFGIGYSAVMPDVLAGARVWYLSGPRRFGVFADAKTTVPNPTGHANYCPAKLGGPCTLDWAQANHNHHVLRDTDHWLVMNAGGMYAFSGEFALLLGGGIGRLNRFREFVDDEEDDDLRITWEGNYLVPHDPRDQNILNLVVGGLVRAGNRISFSFGYETAPGGMTVGLYVVLP